MWQNKMAQNKIRGETRSPLLFDYHSNPAKLVASCSFPDKVRPCLLFL
ncbi:hypothetical protein XIS1_1330006 [Xenorhabdus innexi]|uniref:Uncharacterized protein n=1 Tax=Xenorhabdus innexi TaxID=290109 RepID=A0A1N6MTD9_9GAMM|nr:hypothetical protein XIS1_1330006 [Xenorhabdus innexi]